MGRNVKAGASQEAQTVKNLPAKKETWEIPWRREWQSTPAFLLGKFHGQRSLAGYILWGCKRLEGDLPTKQQRELLCVLVAQSCLTICDPMDCSLPGSSVRGILQARILKWVAMPSSRPRDQTWVSHNGRWIYNLWVTREVPWGAFF